MTIENLQLKGETRKAKTENEAVPKMRFLAAFMLKAKGKFGAALTQLKLAKRVCQDEKLLSVIEKFEREVSEKLKAERHVGEEQEELSCYM